MDLMDTASFTSCAEQRRTEWSEALQEKRKEICHVETKRYVGTDEQEERGSGGGRKEDDEGESKEGKGRQSTD